MKLKVGVRLTDLQPQTVLAMVIVQSILSWSGTDCVITSCNDSKHSEKSLHYRGLAFDFRTKNYKFDKGELMQEVKTALGGEYDVVLEDEDGSNEHLHVEYDPR